MEKDKRHSQRPEDFDPDFYEWEEEEEEIDLMELLHKLVDKRKLLYKAAAYGLVFGILIALGMPKQYTVTVTLAPEMSGAKSGGGGLASLASSFLGTSMNSSPDALNATLSSDIVASTPFILELFDIRVQNEKTAIDTTLVGYLEQQRKPWWGYVLSVPGAVIGGVKELIVGKEEEKAATRNPFELTEDESRQVETLKKCITASVDKKTSMITLSATLQDPKVTAIVADSVVSKLQQYIINYRIAKAKEDCVYLEELYKERQAEYYEAQSKYARYMDMNRSLVLQTVMSEQERLQNDMNLAFQVYSQVAQQLQLARAKIQEAKPVFSVLEPASVPLYPSSTSKKVVALAFAFLAAMGAAAWILFGADFVAQFKKKPEEAEAQPEETTRP